MYMWKTKLDLYFVEITHKMHKLLTIITYVGIQQLKDTYNDNKCHFFKAWNNDMCQNCYIPSH